MEMPDGLESELVEGLSDPAPAPTASDKASKKKRKLNHGRLQISINLEELLALIAATEVQFLGADERKKLKTATMAMYSRIFPTPRSSEKKHDVTGQPKESANIVADEKKPSKHRGRRGIGDYPTAERVPVELEGVTEGQACPCGCGGRLSGKKDSVVLRFVGQAPIQPVAYECERYRCSSCGEVFKAKLPEGAPKKRHAHTAISMIALLKYGSGFPFYRLNVFLSHFGVPLAASTQFEMVAAGVPSVEPAFNEMVRQGAQGELLQSDDTRAKILKFERAPEYADRTGIFTTGILSILGKRKIAIFITGAQHAGENMADVLRKRAEGLRAPIHMADGLAHNSPKLSHPAVVAANCLSHGRRYFVDIVEFFPEHCLYVLDALGTVFSHDALAKDQGLSAEDRLLFHQAFSQPIMDDLKIRMKSELDGNLTEPNSRLGKAFKYMLNHWEKLTLFLRVAGAPIENNAVERQLKKAVLHRKNSLFYRTNRGAKIGDIYMTLIYTCELNGANAYDYLTELQRHAEKVAAAPADWMPWNYRDTLEHILGIRDQQLPNKASPIAA
jgi:hypothetical protein